VPPQPVTGLALPFLCSNMGLISSSFPSAMTAFCIVHFLYKKFPIVQTSFSSTKMVDEGGTRTPGHLGRNILLHDSEFIFPRYIERGETPVFWCIFHNFSSVLINQDTTQISECIT
jgi:hypothetical protein